MMDDYDNMQKIANADIEVLRIKNESYGASWRKRGGTGAFMMLARKWDRLETQCEKHGFDIFKAVSLGRGAKDDILDDIRDLRAYLLLVESHCTVCSNEQSHVPHIISTEDIHKSFRSYDDGIAVGQVAQEVSDRIHARGRDEQTESIGLPLQVAERIAEDRSSGDWIHIDTTPPIVPDLDDDIPF